MLNCVYNVMFNYFRTRPNRSPEKCTRIRVDFYLDTWQYAVMLASHIETYGAERPKTQDEAYAMVRDELHESGMDKLMHEIDCDLIEEMELLVKKLFGGK